MKKLIPTLIFSFFAVFTYGQAIVEITFQETLSKNELAAQFIGANIKNGIEAYKVLYETPDTDGSIDTASGLFVLPLIENRNQSLPILAYQHGTSSSRNAVPSNMDVGERGLAYFFASQGYYTTAADYLGLGESKRAVHPYVHSKSEASAGYDLVRAAKSYLTQQGFPFNNQLFITGYSQGGHAAMSMHKELETNPIEGLTVTAGSPMSGVYNMSGEILKASFSELPYQFPSYPVWIIVSYQSVYGNIYQKPEDVFHEKVLTEIKGFIKGSFTRGELNGLLVNKLTKEYGASLVKNLLNETFLEDFQTNAENPLRLALLDNDLFNWVPAVPMRMMYCTADDQVTFTNSTFTDSVMNANGAMDVLSIDVNPTANHGACVIPAVINTINFFEKHAKRELILSTKNIDKQLAFQINPNPAKDYIYLNFNGLDNNFQEFNLRLINVNGQIVQHQTTTNLQNFLFQLNDVPSGLYIMQVQSKNGFWTEKILIK